MVGGGIDLILSANQSDLNLFTALGSPGVAKLWRIVILDDVVISASSTATPALRTSASFPGGTTFELTFQGQAKIVGKGGAGGAGGSVTGDKITPGGYGGGGGGGASFGAGGASGGGGALPGATGGLELGGAGGSPQAIADAPNVSAGAGAAGGVALETHYPMTLKKDVGGADGSIWGGGGGGNGGEGPYTGGAGGNVGSAGSPGGAAGAAISVQAGSITYTPNKAAFDIRGSAPA